jgi:hypothetical protein
MQFKCSQTSPSGRGRFDTAFTIRSSSRRTVRQRFLPAEDSQDPTVGPSAFVAAPYFSVEIPRV